MEKSELQLIYETFWKALYLYALSLTHHPQEAEDLVQETMIRAYLSYNGKGSIQAWLFRVPKNLFVDGYRKNKHLADAVDPQQEPDFRMDEERILQRMEERKQWLYRKLYTLPQTERDVMILTIASGMNDREIAEILQISVSNLRVIRHRVKEKLKKAAAEEDI